MTQENEKSKARESISKKSNKPNVKKGNEAFSRQNSVDAYNVSDVLPNPDPIWRNNKTNIENYNDVTWDPHLEAVVSSRKSVTTSKEWQIEKGTAPARVVKFVTEAFENFDVKISTREILDANSFGMQPMAVVWGKPEGFDGENKIFPIEFSGRPPYWFNFDSKNILRFRTKENPYPGELIKPYSLILPRNNPKYDNPYGEALLSKVYWAINFKKGGFKFWVEFCERFGLPYIVGKTPRSSQNNETEELYDNLVAASKGTVFTIPMDAKIEVLEIAAKNGGDVFKALCDFANAEISKAYLGGTLTVEAGDRGARSLGDVHDSVREDLAESDEHLVEQTFQQLIRWIVDINFGPTIEAPIFSFVHEEDIKGDVAERDNHLTTQGVVFTKDYYMNTYNLDETDFELKDPEDEPEKDPKGKEFAESSLPASVQAVHRFLDNLSPEDLQKQTAFIKPIVELIQNEKSYGEAEEKLLTIFNAVRPVLVEKELKKAMTGAELIGRGADD